MFPVLSMTANNFTVSYGLVKSGLHSTKEDSTGFINRSKGNRRSDVICHCWEVGMKTPFLRLIGTSVDCFISPNYHSFPYKRIVHPCSSIHLWISPKWVVSTPYNTDIELSRGPCTERWSVSRSNNGLGCSLPFSLCCGTEEGAVPPSWALEWKETWSRAQEDTQPTKLGEE